MNAKPEDTGKLLVRLAVGGLMLFHGVSKLVNGIGWLEGLLGSLGIPGFIGFGVYIGEVIAPVLIIAGYRTRLAGLLVAFDMVAALLLVHRSELFSIKPSGGGWAIELNAFFLLASLSLFFLGAGRYSAVKTPGRWD